MEAKLQLLVQAEDANGVPVHPGLKIPCYGIANGVIYECSGKHHYDDQEYDEEPRDCWRCEGRSWLPNPDPMAMVAECLAQKCTVSFERDDIVFIESRGLVIGESSGSDNQAALTDAMFQATLTLEPDNWDECPACGDTINPGGNPYFSIGGNEMPDGSDCPDCNGTGYLLTETAKEAQDD